MNDKMAVRHDRDARSLYVELPSSGEQVAVSREVHPGVVLYLDAHGMLLGIEVTEAKVLEANHAPQGARH